MEIYKNMKCIACHLHDETFSHIWTCAKRRQEVKALIEHVKKRIVIM